MKKIAYLASRVTLPGSPIRRTDAFEHDNMMDALRGPFEARGYRVEDVAWDNREADWSAFEATIIGTTWDYWDRLDEFLAAVAGGADHGDREMLVHAPTPSRSMDRCSIHAGA